ncbi:MAG: hypothetical protein MUE53_03850 [Chitinophagales bacterium]|jgi:DNA repair exonuclease SbcCD ATPase subunit|nr:hypothetical protein [Chitinophagales bacterium]
MSKTRYVTWATTKKEEKVFITLELFIDTMKIEVVTYDAKLIDKTMEDKFIKSWTVYEAIDLPKPNETLFTSFTDPSILPEHIKVDDNAGAIRILQNEWSFLIINSKILEEYITRLNELKAKVKELNEYNNDVFLEAKEFWDNILEMSKSKEISKEKVNEIKNEIDEVFSKLKDLKENLQKEKEALTESYKLKVDSALKDINAKLQKDNVLFKSLIDELKLLSNDLKNQNLIREVKQQLNSEIDEAFQAVKNKREEVLGQPQDRSSKNQDFIEKLRKSLEYDLKDLAFNEKRVDDARVSQLELQLREAKIKVIKDKIESKQKKLEELENKLK